MTSHPVPPLLRPHRLVLVDDEPGFRSLLRTLLRQTHDFTVVGEAPDGRAALAVVRDLTPDLVVTDLQMPGGGGLAFTRSLRAAYPTLPIVMLTGFPGPEAMDAAFDAGVTAFLDKGSAMQLPVLLRDVLTSEGELQQGPPEGVPG